MSAPFPAAFDTSWCSAWAGRAPTGPWMCFTVLPACLLLSVISLQPLSLHVSVPSLLVSQSPSPVSSQKAVQASQAAHCPPAGCGGTGWSGWKGFGRVTHTVFWDEYAGRVLLKGGVVRWAYGLLRNLGHASEAGEDFGIDAEAAKGASSGRALLVLGFPLVAGHDRLLFLFPLYKINRFDRELQLLPAVWTGFPCLWQRLLGPHCLQGVYSRCAATCL